VPRFFVEKGRINNNVAHIAGEGMKHISRVLRLGVGDKVVLFDETGWEYHATITVENTKELKLDICKRLLPHRESQLELILGQGLPRLSKMDLIIQKGTELGVSKILPFNSHRSIPKIRKEKILKKVERWQKIALEATRQCGRNLIPHIGAPVDFVDILTRDWQDGLKLILWEGEAMGLKKVFDINPGKNKFIVLVGPEGGFTNSEIKESQKAGFKLVSLGNRILRSETASISILSIIQHRFGDLN